ncbi:hypothetical protein Scep_006421 [Stephania cephalantha]|uniref:Hexosyltransferase n=1 Tax=Stephania cephalantha TaxID=152367 RepID=A0AAP0K9V6_9MAGN
MCIASLHRTLSASLYPFRSSSVLGLISSSICFALNCPINYARNYLPHLLPLCLRRVVYLDSDLLLIDDIAKLSATPLGSSIILAAPEYCNANFTSYFTPTFWSNPALSLTFFDRRPFYFNTGSCSLTSSGGLMNKAPQVAGGEKGDADRIWAVDFSLRQTFVAVLLLNNDIVASMSLILVSDKDFNDNLFSVANLMQSSLATKSYEFSNILLCC